MIIGTVRDEAHDDDDEASARSVPEVTRSWRFLIADTKLQVHGLSTNRPQGGCSNIVCNETVADGGVDFLTLSGFLRSSSME
jgi:hypothetical protein